MSFLGHIFPLFVQARVSTPQIRWSESALFTATRSVGVIDLANSTGLGHIEPCSINRNWPLVLTSANTRLKLPLERPIFFHDLMTCHRYGPLQRVQCNRNRDEPMELRQANEQQTQCEAESCTRSLVRAVESRRLGLAILTRGAKAGTRPFIGCKLDYEHGKGVSTSTFNHVLRG